MCWSILHVAAAVEAEHEDALLLELLDDVREVFAAAIKKHFNEDVEV